MKKAIVTSVSAIVFALIACLFDHISVIYSIGLYASMACLIAFVVSLFMIMIKEESGNTTERTTASVKPDSSKNKIA